MRHFGISSAPNAADDPDFASDDLRMNVCYPRVAETTVPAHTPAAPHEAGTVTQFSRPQRLRGRDTAAGASTANTRGELFPFPPKSVRDDPLRPLLERSYVAQTALDVLAVGAAVLFVSITSLSVVASALLLLFVRF